MHTGVGIAATAPGQSLCYRGLTVLALGVLLALCASSKAQEQPGAKPATETPAATVSEAQVAAELESLGAIVKTEGDNPAGPVVEVTFPYQHIPPYYYMNEKLLVRLKVLTQLKHLDLSGCAGMTDAMMKNLKGMAQLRYLSLGGHRVSDVGITELAGLTELRWLSLSATLVTDAGMVNLEGMTHLQNLFLCDIKVGDAGMVHIKGLTALKLVNVWGSHVTDAGLENFQGLSNLRFLRTGVKATDQGRKKLQEVLPKCAIVS